MIYSYNQFKATYFDRITITEYLTVRTYVKILFFSYIVFDVLVYFFAYCHYYIYCRILNKMGIPNASVSVILSASEQPCLSMLGLLGPALLMVEIINGLVASQAIE